MAFEDADRPAFADGVPVFAEARDDGTFRLVATDTGDVVSSEHATVRDALNAALELDSVSGFRKSGVMRSVDGELDGEFRWFDATSVEPEPLGPPGDEARIAEQAIWELAESLNQRASTLPINGGPTPEGLAASEPHGDMKHGGDHPANGALHVGLPVEASDGLHLFLFGEVMPDVAAEVDRGRLAQGSVFFRFDETDPDDNLAVKGATLTSHALTNDPAVTNLTPGSERSRRTDKTKRACRSRWSLQMTTTIDQFRDLHTTVVDEKAGKAVRHFAALDFGKLARGAAGDLLGEIARMLNLTDEAIADDPWAISDAISALSQVAQVEDIVEAPAAPAADAPATDLAADAAARTADTLTPEQAAEFVALVKRGAFGPVVAARAVEGLEGEELDAALQGFVDLGRNVLGKPDAEVAAVLEELQAREAELAAVLAPEEDTTGETDTEEDAAQVAEAAASAGERGARRVLRIQRNTERTAHQATQAKLDRFEMREYLTGKLKAAKQSVVAETFDRWVKIGLKNGREVVDEFVAGRNAPPSAMPMDDVELAKPDDIRTKKDAWDACMVDAREKLDEDEKRQAAKTGRKTGTVARHVVRALAQRLAPERYPDIFGAPAR